MGGGATRSPAVSAGAGAGAGTGAAGAEFRAALLLSSSSRSAACSRACLSRCSSSSFSLKRDSCRRLQTSTGFPDASPRVSGPTSRYRFSTYRSCITGDITPRDTGGSMSGLYRSPYRGYEGSPGNNGGLSIPHRSRYNCSSNLRGPKKVRRQFGGGGGAVTGDRSRGARAKITYKRAGGVAVGRDWGDRDYRPQDPRQTPAERGPDGARAGTAESRNGPAARTMLPLRCACWHPRAWQSCTTRGSPRVFFREWTVPKMQQITRVR